MGGDLVAAAALALAIEGSLYALFPEAMKRLMAQVLELPVTTLRTAGALATALGVGIVWMVRG